jgi:lambda family phage portal protein
MNANPFARLAAWYLRRTKKRAFEAADNSRLRTIWRLRSSTLSADAEIYRDHASLVARSREQSINNPYAKKYYHLLKTNAIGPNGLSLRSRAVDRLGERDGVAAALLEDHFARWQRKGSCEVTGRLRFVEFACLWLESLARDGEILVRRVRGWSRNPYAYALQIIEADRLDVRLNRELKNGRRIRHGVELDEWESPQAYYLRAKHPGEHGAIFEGRTYQRFEAREILHSFLPWRAHQTRGFPWSHASMVELHHTKEYRASEMIAAEVGAKRLGFYEQDPEAFDEAPADDQGAVDETVEAGIYKLLPYGIRFKEGASNHPAPAFEAFLKNSIRGISAGLLTAYNKLANDLEGVSFSSLRSGELEDRDTYRLLQGYAAEELYATVFADWLEMALTAGALPGLGMRDHARLEAAAWQGRGWQWVSPKDEATANDSALRSRLTSRSRIIRERGDDPLEVFAELAGEEALLAALGLSAFDGDAPAPEVEGAPEDRSDTGQTRAEGGATGGDDGQRDGDGAGRGGAGESRRGATASNPGDALGAGGRGAGVVRLGAG